MKAEDLQPVIDELSAQLGDERYEKRSEVTGELIRLGKGGGLDDDADAKAKKLVQAKMNKLRKASDLEVATRAKTVLAAMEPKPVPKPPPSDDGWNSGY